MTDHDMLAVKGRLDAEAAALIARCDDPDLGGRKLEQVGESKAFDVGTLGREVKGEPVGFAPDRERAPGLDRADAAALSAEALPEHHVGVGEQRLDLGVVLRDLVRIEAARIAAGEDLVVVPVVVDAQCAVAERSLGVGDHGERLVVDLHVSGRVLGDVLVFRHDRGDRLAVPVHLVHRERPVLPIVGSECGDQHRNLLALHLLRELGAGDGADHARRPERRLQPDVLDPGVRVAGADEAEIQAIGHAEIGQVFAAPGEEARILAPLQRAANPARLPGCGHGGVSVSAGGGAGFTPWRMAEAARIASTMWL